MPVMSAPSADTTRSPRCRPPRVAKRLRDRNTEAAALARGDAGQRRRLGVAVAPPRVAKRLRRAVGLPERDGVLVREVEDGSPADRGGLQRGDLVVSADGADITGIDDLYAALDSAGESLKLGVVRGTEELELEVPFAAAAEEVA